MLGVMLLTTLFLVLPLFEYSVIIHTSIVGAFLVMRMVAISTDMGYRGENEVASFKEAGGFYIRDENYWYFVGGFALLAIIGILIQISNLISDEKKRVQKMN